MLRSALLFIFLSLSITAGAQLMPMGLTGAMMLLAMPEVKKEVRLTKAQEKQIQEITKELEKNPGQFGMFDMHYLTRPIDLKVVSILEPPQSARIRELFWQFNGLLALSETDLCEALGLSDSVKSSAKALIKTHDKVVMDEMMARKGKFDKKALKALGEKTALALEALLTPEQVETWKTLQGKPFKFPKR
ncbi:MAG: hypothetical protein K8R88_08760 [Armatimonadetes bacterium]|nr:hypothetical protein [Armatimonadota bacterium]